MSIPCWAGLALTSVRTLPQSWDLFWSTVTSSSSARSLPACMYDSTAPIPVSLAAICRKPGASLLRRAAWSSAWQSPSHSMSVWH